MPNIDVVIFVLNNLTQLLEEEANLLSGVKKKVILLHQELERIRAFLRRTEGKRDGHEMVKVAVRRQMRDLALEAQDVIDHYVVDIINHRRKGTLAKFFHRFDKAKMLHSVNNQIETIEAKMKHIYDNKDKYDISEGESAALKMEALSLAETVQRRRRDVEEDEVVGFDEYADEVNKLLVKGNTSRQVVSIVGTVGCGKTTLARKVFRDLQLNVTTSQQDSTTGFDCLAWEIATEEFNAKELLLSILKSFKGNPEDEVLKRIKKDRDEKESDSAAAKTQEIAMLKKMLREYLSNITRYLVVIDDVWSSHVLEEIGDAFPDDNRGSRILITTRSEEVASEISTTEPYKLKPLSDEDSWILLSKKVFRGEKYCPPNLETVGRNIAIAYMGSPLAIVVIAGILRRKEKSERVWEKVGGHANWYISQDITLVKEIARLSYETLPRRLKPCFLYFGIYPEDYDIPVRQLLQLWIAEGFIHETGDGSMIHEDIAEEYLEELIRRNLIQVESRRMDGGVKTCRIHDRLRELCMSERMGDNFLEVRNDNNILKEGKPRRLSIHGSITYYMSESPCDHSCARSLFNFSKEEYSAFEFKTWLRKYFKLIRVLDMGQVRDSSHVVDELEELIHLRYCRAKDANLPYSFPKSIYDLWNLETLDLRGSGFDDLPDGIWKLKRLRHLYMLGFASKATLPNIPERKILPNLQTLSGVCLDRKTAQQLEKGRFPNLRKLVVDCLHSSDIENPVEYLRKLQCLSHLNSLKVIHGAKALTSVEGFPPNITKITLVGGHYLSEIASPLGSLPKLRYLKISENSDQLKEFKLECLRFACFPQLQVLKMTGLNCVGWNMGEGAMPQLRRLVINRCEFSTSLPSAESFTSLKEVKVSSSSKEVVDKLQHLVNKKAALAE